MDVKCPVCDEKVSSEKGDELTMALKRHLEDMHAYPIPETETERKVRTFAGTEAEKLPGEVRTKVEEVAQFKGARAGETAEEKAVETFAGREPYGGPEEAKKAVEAVEKFKTAREGEAKEECETRTFSETECVGVPEETKVLKEEVGGWTYPRTGPGGERGPALQCPVCGVPMKSSEEAGLSSELKEHFTEAHDLEKMKIEMKR